MCSVSVIIPIFNGEKYLKKCLDSICCQTLENIEIICINDGSTDNSISILNKYSLKDNRIKVISTENKGQGHARNIALNIATGEYISFVDADDWIECNTYESLYHKAKFHDLDMLFFQLVNYIDDSGELIESDLYNHSCFENNHFNENSIFSHEDTKDFLFEIPVCPVSKLYKKEFLDVNNIRFPEGFLFEDNSFFYNSYFKCEKAGFFRKHFYYRRRHSSSVTQTFDEKKYDIVKATNEVLDVFLDNDKYQVYKSNLINHVFSMLMEWFKKLPLNLKQGFFEFIKDNFYGFDKLKIDFKINLIDKYLLVFDLIVENAYYLDFLSQYKLATVDYVIFDNGREYKLNSESYYQYIANKNDNYVVSVIIPIYNNEKIIHRTLMSIENQTLGIENIEVLMINDSSSDGTEKVINDYSRKYSNFKSIHIINGTGSPGTPRNIGLKEASSNHVIFLDHDDFFEINALKKLYDLIIKYDCDFVYGTYASVDDDSPTKIIYPNEYHGFFKNISENERSIGFPPPSIWTKMFKRDFLLKNKILFPTILGEDAIFISKALFNAKNIYYSWNLLVCFHVLNEKSYTNNISYKYLNEGLVSEEYMYNFYNDYHHKEYYKIRAEGILDFYLTQFIKSDINQLELINLFPLIHDFVKRIDLFGLKPHTSEDNKIMFEYILEEDIDSIKKFKHLEDPKISRKSMIINFFNKFFKKLTK